MLNLEIKAEGSKQSAGSSHVRSAACLALFTLCLLFCAGCRRDMQDQPKYVPLRATTFFADGQSARPLVEGTIPRGYLREDKAFYTGKTGAAPTGAQKGYGLLQAPEQSTSVLQPGPPAVSSGTVGPEGNVIVTIGQGAILNVKTGETATGSIGADVDTFPFPITQEVLNRGQERFQIFCSMCHGYTGYGDGMIVRRGFRRPPSYHEERLRKAPVGHFFDVITNGWGSMPDYAQQVPVQDRWAIVAYIRALQYSQNAPVADLPPQDRARIGSGGATAAPAGGGPEH